MKIYPSLQVETFYSSLGNTWQIHLVGGEDDVNSVFSGIYNLGGLRPHSKSSGALDWDTSKTRATFNSSELLMWNFFYNLSQMRGESENESKIFANNKIEELKTNQICSERYNQSRNFEGFSTGKIVSERPDYDFKDSVIIDGFRARERENTEEMELV